MWQHPFPKDTITSRFGVTARRSSPHRGLDYAPRGGTPIPAVSKGTVRLVQWSDVLGWVLVQTAWDHQKKKTVFVGYCHLEEKPKLTKGQKIEMGDIIGKVGNTGSASRGNHLHLTIGSKVKAVFYGAVFDPEAFIDNQIALTKVCPTCKRPL